MKEEIINMVIGYSIMLSGIYLTNKYFNKVRVKVQTLTLKLNIIILLGGK